MSDQGAVAGFGGGSSPDQNTIAPEILAIRLHLSKLVVNNHALRGKRQSALVLVDDLVVSAARCAFVNSTEHEIDARPRELEHYADWGVFPHFCFREATVGQCF